MVNITATLGLPTVFVRFNPDQYKPASGKQASAAKRKEVLLRVLEHHMSALNVSPEEAEGSTTGCWMVQLFFDGYDHSTQTELVGV